MDQAALVDDALRDAAALNFELQPRYLNLHTPIVAEDPETGELTILIGVPDSASRRELYEEIQGILSGKELAISVEQVSLVKESDAGLKELRSLVDRRPHGTAGSGVSVAVAGRYYTNPRSALPSYRQFETALESALRSVVPESVSLQAEASPQTMLAVKPRVELSSARADFIAWRGNRILLIEAKSSRRPLAPSRVFEGLGQLSFFQRQIGEEFHLELMLVSMSGFLKTTREQFAMLSDVFLVEWSIGDDTSKIGEALVKAFPSDE